MERRKFEDDFAKAFEDAGITPGENVWTNIELDLERQQGTRMKRRVLFYQVLAAASVTFAVIVAGLGYYAMTSRPDGEALATVSTPADKQHEVSTSPKKSEASSSDQAGSTIATENVNGIPFDNTKPEEETAAEEELIASALKQKDQERKTKPVAREENSSLAGSNNTANQFESQANLPHSNENILPTESTKMQNVNTKSDRYIASNEPALNGLTERSSEDKNDNKGLPSTGQALSSRQLPVLYQAKSPSLSFDKEAESTADPVALMFARLNDLEKELAGTSAKKRSAKSENLWTSVGFAAGGFSSVNPSFSSEPSPVLQNNFTASNTTGVNNQAKASGTAYSAGVSMGKRISERWVVQGGVNYLTQISSYTADVAFGSADLSSFKAASLNQFADGRLSDDNKAIPTAPYSVYSNVEILTLPVQAGYIIVNRKVALQLNAGVSTDFFLQNTINPEGETIQTTTQGAGADSPYRTVNMSGLIGTELSYRFADRYRLTLNPGLRYPFNSIYKEDTGVDASPLIFDLGLRFRYIFQ